MFDTRLWDDIPDHCKEGLRGYIEKGEPVGSFLSALLSNDLRKTYEKADDTNIGRIKNYLMFLYNEAPSECWGSPDKYAGWQKRGGLHGLPPVQGSFDDEGNLA
jgi:hypothetical protein